MIPTKSHVFWSRMLRFPLGWDATTDPGMTWLATTDHIISTSQFFPSQRRIIIYPGTLARRVGSYSRGPCVAALKGFMLNPAKRDSSAICCQNKTNATSMLVQKWMPGGRIASETSSLQIFHFCNFPTIWHSHTLYAVIGQLRGGEKGDGFELLSQLAFHYPHHNFCHLIWTVTWMLTCWSSPS